MKKVIVLKEHNGTIYLDASTPYNMQKACLSILRARTSTNEYKDWVHETSKEPKKPELSFEQAEALPEGKVKCMALTEWSEYHKAVEQHKKDMRQIQLVKEAVDDGDGKQAYRILTHKILEEAFEIVDVLEEYPNG